MSNDSCASNEISDGGNLFISTQFIVLLERCKILKQQLGESDLESNDSAEPGVAAVDSNLKQKRQL